MVYRKVKPQAHEKSKRNSALVEYHVAHPEATMAEIAEMFGISTVRVYQIVKRGMNG